MAERLKTALDNLKSELEGNATIAANAIVYSPAEWRPERGFPADKAAILINEVSVTSRERGIGAIGEPWMFALIQTDVWAKSNALLRTVSNAVIDEIHSARISITGVLIVLGPRGGRSLKQNTAGFYRRILNWELWI